MGTRIPICRDSWLATVVVTAVLLLSACDGSSATVGVDDGRSPLEVALNSSGDSQEQVVSVRAEMMQRAELVSECMLRKGFEYIPWVPPSSSFYGEASVPSRDYVELHGYGISTDPDRNRQAAEAQRDPNFAITEALSPEEAAEYERALTGIDPTTVGSEPAVVETGGCMKEADDALAPVNAVPTDLIDEYYTLRNQLEVRISEDRRVREALNNWRVCMVDHNYSFEYPSEVPDSVFAEWERLVPDPAPAIASPVEASTLDRTELAKYVNPDLFDELMKYELQVASIDYECQTEYREVEAEVRLEMETVFVEDNAGLLERVSPAIR